MKIRLADFLAPFFPDENEPFRLRAIPPKGYPKGKDNPASKPFGELYTAEFTVTRSALVNNTLLRKFIRRENELKGIYFVVNAGIPESKRLDIGACARLKKQDGKIVWTQYVTDEDITRFNAFFAEDDRLSIDEQLKNLESCPLSPSIIVITRKSVHSYWLCVAGITREQWRDIQERLISYFHSDGDIKNPSRLMRVPNLDHIAYDFTTQSVARKMVEVGRFEPERLFTYEDMSAAFPAVEIKQVSDWRPPAAGTGEYRDWDELGDELRRRMAAHPSAHRDGDKIVLKGVCHDGAGDSAAFFNTVTGKYYCSHPGCEKEDLLRAFGLPERPTERREIKPGNRIALSHASAMQITDKSWTENPAVSDFVERFRKAQSIVAPVRVEEVAGDFIDGELEGLEAWTTADDNPVDRKVGVCADCRGEAALFGAWCFECDGRRAFLANKLPCGCDDANRWRHRDGGFYWHCGVHERAPADAVWSGGLRVNTGNVVVFPSSVVIGQGGLHEN